MNPLVTLSGAAYSREIQCIKKFARRNPGLTEQSHRKPGRMFLSSGAVLPSKNPCEISGTPEPATSPVIPHFPHPPNFRGHNFGKMRNRAGIIQRSPTGTDEVGYSNVTKTKKVGWDVVWDAGGHRSGDTPASTPGSIRDKVEFSRAKLQSKKNFLFWSGNFQVIRPSSVKIIGIGSIDRETEESGDRRGAGECAASAQDQSRGLDTGCNDERVGCSPSTRCDSFAIHSIHGNWRGEARR